MKEPLKLPFIFLLILLCAVAILAALDLLSTWGMFESGARPFTIGYALQRLPRSAFEVMIPSVVLSIVLLGFRMARKPISRFLGLLIALSMSYVALVNGMIWLKAWAGVSKKPAETPRQYVNPLTFTRIGGSIISARSIARSIDGEGLRGILLFQAGKPEQRFSVFPSASMTVADGTLTVKLADGKPVDLAGKPERIASAVFAPDRITSLFLRDVGTLTRDFESMLAGSLADFFAACFSLLFLCVASLMLLRLTRWPLANITLLMLAARGYFLLYHALAVTLVPEVEKVVTDRLVVRMFPSAVMAALGILLLLIDILFIPPDRLSRLETA